MTCIVGIVENGKVTIGGDSAGIGAYVVTIRADSKVFRNGSFLIGYTSSFRMGQLLRYAFTPPERAADVDVFRYLATSFVDAVRDCFKAGGYARKESEQESGGCFLIGYERRLFVVDSDFQVAESALGYIAVGSGAEVALGALYATQGRPVRERIETAITAAAQFTAGVRLPCVIEEL